MCQHNHDKIYFRDDMNGAINKAQTIHIIKETSYYLNVKIFGNDCLVLSSFIQLKRTIAQMKITPTSWC